VSTLARKDLGMGRHRRSIWLGVPVVLRRDRGAADATPGVYALRLTFRDAGTGRTARSETQVVLEK
jgi:hypothetical protein